MKIVIPMSGFGTRFLNAGYILPKPLLLVDGKPIIEYVVSLFPGEEDFIFICNEQHLSQTNMAEVLKKIKPKSKIVSIKPHKKGPVYAVSQAFSLINDNEEVIVSYCDFSAVWDYEKFKKIRKEKDFDGAIPSYIGFHPHLLHKKLYGGLLADKNNFVLDYREKHCFTENPMESFQSAGIYYYRSAKEMKQYSIELMEKNINLNGEFYSSMVYYLYLRDKKRLYIPKIRFFCQWGTPEDLEEYEAWSRLFHKLYNVKKKQTSIPKARKIAIPWKKNTDNYIRSYNYWNEYFKLRFGKNG